MILRERQQMNNTIYVYDKNNGKIKYTIDLASPAQIEYMAEKGEHFYIGPAGAKISGSFVKLDDEGNPIGISRTEHMNFININKHVVVANGTDEAIISGLRYGMFVDVNHEYQYVVDEETGRTLELSCNNFSYVPQQNEMRVYMKAYGCHDSVITINFVEET